MRFGSNDSFARPSASAADWRPQTRIIDRISRKSIVPRCRPIAEECDRVSHSPRRYLHIEAVFVFATRFHHLSTALAGRAIR
jgi:hypothetical protein